MSDDEYNPYGTQRQDGDSAYDDLDEYTRVSAGTPIWGWLSGTQSQVEAARAKDAASTNRSYWDQLAPPTQDQLMGPQGAQDAQQRALDQMEQWSGGGLTAADRSMMESTRARDAQASGAARGAVQQQAQARGVGGSGLEMAGAMAANQQGQQQASDQESAMMQGAQQRGLQATQYAGNLAGDMRQTGIDATQQSYTDAANRAAGATGQYSTDAAGASGRAQRDAQRDQGLLAALAELAA